MIGSIKFFSVAGLICISLTTFSQKKQYLLVGTYTNGKSNGVYVYSFDSKAENAKLVDSVKTSNPSYLAVSQNKKFVYAVNEDAEQGVGGKVTALSFDKASGKLSFLNQQLSMGDHPCYVTVDRSGKWVMVGNYSSGTAAVLPVQKNGGLGPAVSTVTHQGSSINKQRQESAHVHATVLSPDNQFLFVTDLGTDKLEIYPFNNATGFLDSARSTTITVEAGSGPRHFTFHPNQRWAYLVQELSGTVTAFSYSRGALRKLQSVSTLPAGFNKSFTSADIHVAPDGKFLYVSNRDSSNTIAIFKIDGQKGTLRVVGHQPVLGNTPRNFNFDPTGRFLLVANQRSDVIVIFKRNLQTGLLQDTGKRIHVGSPVCIQWAE